MSLSGSISLDPQIFIPTEHKRHAPDVVLRTESKEEVSPVLYEGDIIIPDVPALDTTSRQLSGKSKRAVTNATELRWENATVPYKFDTNFRKLCSFYVNVTGIHTKLCSGLPRSMYSRTTRLCLLQF